MIEWLLGGSAALGLAGSIVLGIYAVRTISTMASRGRGDLLNQITQADKLIDLRLDKASLENAVSDLSDALALKEDELARERAAYKELSDALDRATNELAKSGTTSGALASLRASLDRLRKLSEVSAAPAATGDEDTDRVHGPAAEADLKPRSPGGSP